MGKNERSRTLNMLPTVSILIIILFCFLAYILYRQRNPLEKKKEKTLTEKKGELIDAIHGFIFACQDRDKIIGKLEQAKSQYRETVNGPIKYEYLTDEFRIENKKKLKELDAKINKHGKYIIKNIPNRMIVELDGLRVYKEHDYKSFATVTCWMDLYDNGKFDVTETARIEGLLY